MKRADFLLVLLGVMLNAMAQLLLKWGASSVGPIDSQHTTLGDAASRLAWHPGVWAGLACYAVSVVVWIVALSRVDVSMAYPMLSMGYIVTAILAWSLLGEALTPQRWIGIAVIVLGVVLVSRS